MNEFIIKNGLISKNNSIISGSLIVTQGITGSLFGTASYATNALTSSYALNGGVTQLLAGPNVTLSPTNGLGQVTISSTSGGGGFNTATGSYGSFYDTTIQTNVAGTARSMSLNTTDITNGVSVSGSTNPFNTYIKTENAGVYDIQFSAQVDKTDSGTDKIWIWLRKNGTDLTDTATSIQLTGNGAHYVAAWNFFVNAAANDYFQLMWYSPDANVRLHAEPAFGVVPGIPSLIVTVNRVDQFLSNTGSFSGQFSGSFSGSFTGQFTGSLFGTSSWANNAITSSYILNAVSSSFSQTASYILNAVSSSFALTASSVNTLNQNVTITGSAFISTSLYSPIVYGGVNSGNSLTLSSTTNATKGNIVFGTSNYSELNNTLGLGVAANSLDRLSIQGIGNTSATDVISAVNSNGNVLFKSQDNGQLFIGPVSSSTAMGTNNALLFISQSLATGSTHTTTIYGTLVNQNIFSRSSNNAASMFGSFNQYNLQIDPSQTATGTILVGRRDNINFTGSSPTSTTYILADIIFGGGSTTPIWRISAASSSAVANNNSNTVSFGHQILISQGLTSNSINAAGGVIIGGGGNTLGMNVGPGVIIGTGNTLTNTGGGTQFVIGLNNNINGNFNSAIGYYNSATTTNPLTGPNLSIGTGVQGWNWGIGLAGSAAASSSIALQLKLGGNIVRYRNTNLTPGNGVGYPLGLGSHSNMSTLLIGGLILSMGGSGSINSVSGVALVTGSLLQNTSFNFGNSFTEPGTTIIATTGSNADLRLTNSGWVNTTAVYVGTVFSSSLDINNTGSLFIDWAPNTDNAQRIGTGGIPPTGSNYWIWRKPDEFRFSKSAGQAVLNIDTAGKIGIWADVTSSYSSTTQLSAMLDINVGSVVNSNGQVSVSGSNIYPQIRLRGMSGNPSSIFTLDGSLWYLSTNSRLMIRQGSNTREIITSSGSVGAASAAAGSIDIVVNNTTYNVLYK
jgi:hypothetical protein